MEQQANGMNEAATRWVRGLPIRWALGGLVLGVVWMLASAVVLGSFANPAGGYTASLLRSFWFVLLPLAVLGFGWGLSERLDLERWSTRGEARLARAIDQYALRQTGKAMVCSMLFAFLHYSVALVRSFHPWDSMTTITANVGILVRWAFVGVPLGFLVGIITRRNLQRRLSRDHGEQRLSA